jgi:hypothetical protein
VVTADALAKAAEVVEMVCADAENFSDSVDCEKFIGEHC